MERKKRIFLIVGLAVIVVLAAGIAYAQVSFPDVDAANPHKAGIDFVAENGIAQGYTNGNFGPYDNILRGQAATMFKNYEDFRMEPVEARRGCTDCHQGPFTLKQEAVLNANIGSHTSLPDNAGLNDCLNCHAIEADLTGNVAPLALRDIVHPAHMGSKIFAWELMGNCFSCHNVDATGQFDVLGLAVATDEKGIPDVVPIPGQQDPMPVGGGTTSTSTTSTTVPSTTTTSMATTTTTEDTTTTTEAATTTTVAP